MRNAQLTSARVVVLRRRLIQIIGCARRATLRVSEGTAEALAPIVSGVVLCRDLINTAPNAMGPAELAAAAQALAEEYDARIEVITNTADLLERFPMVHAVGRAAAPGREPRVVDMCWGSESAPKVTIVGKGVCFDTGGLDVKPPAAMGNMKKDMGGAANALGLAKMVMASGVNVRLRVLLGCVENSIGPDAFRPSDVLTAANGITVEVGNTDAEGRLVIADALALADEEVRAAGASPRARWRIRVPMRALTPSPLPPLVSPSPRCRSLDHALSRSPSCCST